VALEILEHVRAQNGKPPLSQAGRPVKYLFAAEQLGIGQSHLERIDLKVSALDAQGRLTPTELW